MKTLHLIIGILEIVVAILYFCKVFEPTYLATGCWALCAGINYLAAYYIAERG